MAASDEMLYGDILDTADSPRTPVEDETYGDLFDDVLRSTGQEKVNDTPMTEITEADIALLDATDDKPSSQVAPPTHSGVGVSKPPSSVNTVTPKDPSFPSRPNTIYQEPMKKSAVFIGGMTWWTTDQDIIAAFNRIGFTTIRALKIYENRTNGQSKGYAQIELGNEEEAIAATEKIQEIEIHGQKVIAMYAMKTSPHQFELRCKGEGTGLIASSSNAPPKPPPRLQPPPPSSMSQSIRQHNLPPNSTTMRGPLLTDPTGVGMPVLPGIGLPGMIPGNPFDPLGYLRPPIPGIPPGFPPGLGLQRPPLPEMMGAQGVNRATAPHVNPAFFFKQQWEGGANNMASSSPSHLGMGSGLEEDELSEVMHRNQQVSATAIQRAQDEAESGDIDGAIDTLRMAINIIKQSTVAKMDSTQVLIKSLQDWMTSIEGQSSSRHSSSRRHDDKERSSRHRDRSRDRDYRSSRHRDRSRERRRY